MYFVFIISSPLAILTAMQFGRPPSLYYLLRYDEIKLPAFVVHLVASNVFYYKAWREAEVSDRSYICVFVAVTT
jgi:hypothetical protein